MKTCPTTRRVARSLDHDLLTSVLTRLEHQLLADDPGHGGVLFGVAGTDADGVTLATRHLDVADPVEAMIGYSAPADWSAFGIVTRGRSAPAARRRSPPPGRHRRPAVSGAHGARGRPVRLGGQRAAHGRRSVRRPRRRGRGDRSHPRCLPPGAGPGHPSPRRPGRGVLRPPLARPRAGRGRRSARAAHLGRGRRAALRGRAGGRPRARVRRRPAPCRPTRR